MSRPNWTGRKPAKFFGSSTADREGKSVLRKTPRGAINSSTQDQTIRANSIKWVNKEDVSLASRHNVRRGAGSNNITETASRPER